MINHNSFNKEIKNIAKKHPSVYKDLEQANNLLLYYFKNNRSIIGNGKIHRVFTSPCNTYEIWKYEMKVKSIHHPNQWPRLWFKVNFPDISINCLCIHTHNENYDNNKIDNEAKERALELFA